MSQITISNIDYTVGWVCAIAAEYDAAIALLDEAHDGPEPVPPRGEGGYGKFAATDVVRGLLHSFPNVRISLMVGIGGGAPSPKHDIRLGDVVVGTPSVVEGSVIQYDYGKTIRDQTFRAARYLDYPPAILRHALVRIQTEHEIEGFHLADDIRPEYKRPLLSSDRLYQSEFIHPPDNSSSCAITCGDKPSTLVSRPERTGRDDNPMIHYGLIASANNLMKDASIRDRLIAEKDVLCFETEAAGLMEQFPCLVIRGICDYSDSHRNKEWQNYAAMSAAAYAKHLLHRIPPNVVDAERKISEYFRDVIEQDESESHTNEDIEAPQFEVPATLTTESWDKAARSRAQALLDTLPPAGHHPTLFEVVRDRIWPFYADWVDELLGPCARIAEFKRNEDGDIISVTICITCTTQADEALQMIVDKYTKMLVPEDFRTQNRVLIEFGEGSTNAFSKLEFGQWV